MQNEAKSESDEDILKDVKESNDSSRDVMVPVKVMLCGLSSTDDSFVRCVCNPVAKVQRYTWYIH